jgi:MFS family permease
MTEIGAAAGHGHPALRMLKWIGGTFAVSVALPAIAFSTTELLEPHPLGDLVSVNTDDLDASVALAAVAVPVLGIVLGAIALSWRVSGLAVIALIGAVIGLIAGVICASYLRWHAYETAAQQSADLVAAIERYEETNGQPPKQLSDLVPSFILAVPDTGMRAAATFQYGSWSGPCSEQNGWHLSLQLGSDETYRRRMFYCPRRDYRLEPIEDGLDYTTFEPVGAWVYATTELDD